MNEPWVKNLDYDTLERIDKSFVTEEFVNRESDIIYRIEFKGEEVFIYLLIECQSTVDRYMALRMLRYIAEFYEYLVSTKKMKKLPAVFPVMLYNGERKWTSPEEISNLVERSIPDKYIPSFRYYKIAENELQKETLLNIRNVLSAVFYLENSDMSDVAGEIKHIVKLIESERPEEPGHAAVKHKIYPTLNTGTSCRVVACYYHNNKKAAWTRPGQQMGNRADVVNIWRQFRYRC